MVYVHHMLSVFLGADSDEDCSRLDQAVDDDCAHARKHGPAHPRKNYGAALLEPQL